MLAPDWSKTLCVIHLVFNMSAPMISPINRPGAGPNFGQPRQSYIGHAPAGRRPDQTPAGPHPASSRLCGARPEIAAVDRGALDRQYAQKYLFKTILTFCHFCGALLIVTVTALSRDLSPTSTCRSMPRNRTCPPGSALIVT